MRIAWWGVVALMSPGMILAQKVGRITVGPNVHVSKGLPTATHDEVLIDADPENANRLIACSIYQPDHGLFSERDVVYVSLDGGKTWSEPMDVDSIATGGTKPKTNHYVDPTCVFGINGTMHFGSMPVQAYWSSDNGKTWNRSEMQVPGSTDRDFLIVDQSGGKYNGRVYMHAQMSGPVLDKGYMDMAITLWRSLDGGKTFERPIQAFPNPNQESGVGFHPGNSVVLSDGTWAAVVNHLQTLPWIGSPNDKAAHIKVITSTDGGETLNKAVTVADAYRPTTGAASTLPMMAADTRSALFKDRMYVTWDDRVNGRFQIMLSYSDDRGKTWATPRIVNDDQRYRDEEGMRRDVGRIAVAVNKAGVVGVVWEDRRDNTKNEFDYDLRFTASLDGGDTFLPSVKVSEKPKLHGPGERWITSAQSPNWGAKNTFDVEKQSTGFHTIGLTADANGVFHPVWTSNPTGVNQVYTATMTVEGSPVKFGNTSLASSNDLTSQVKIEVVGSFYDPVTRRVTVRTRLRNDGKDTITGPVKVRGIIMTSEATTSGTAAAFGAENGVSGPGATWDFTNQISGGALVPGATTAERTLVFELGELRAMGGKTFAYSYPAPRYLIHFEGQVVGSTRRRPNTVHP
jgi:hypothetical protein